MKKGETSALYEFQLLPSEVQNPMHDGEPECPRAGLRTVKGQAGLKGHARGALFGASLGVNRARFINALTALFSGAVHQCQNRNSSFRTR